jgi:hypothetical protein
VQRRELPEVERADVGAVPDQQLRHLEVAVSEARARFFK